MRRIHLSDFMLIFYSTIQIKEIKFNKIKMPTHYAILLTKIT